jgi:cell wall-associated NlpC family hydrolase
LTLARDTATRPASAGSPVSIPRVFGSFDYSDLLGKEFAYGGRGPETFDCWGLCEEIYRRLGRTPPRYPTPVGGNPEAIHNLIQRHKGAFIRLESPEPWCFAVFSLRGRYVSHIGIVLEDSWHFIHILEKSRVAKERLDSIVWKRRVRGFYRWVI